MKSWILRKATKKWLRRYARRELVPSVRAVFIGDFVSEEVLLYEYYDTLTLDFYNDVLFPNLSHASTALDIGANIGNHTSVISKHFDHVIAFEPNPQVALLLRANLMGQSIDVFELGLSDQQGCRKFEVNVDNLGASNIADDDTDADLVVDVDTIDRLSEQLDFGNVGFIKIDVEGHEAKVLAGAQSLLATQHPVIALDLHSYLVADVAGQVDREIKKAGYRFIYALLPEREKGGRWIPIRWIPKIFRPKVKRLVLKSIDGITGEYGQIIISNKSLTPQL